MKRTKRPQKMSAAGKKILAGLKQLQTALETGDFSRVIVRGARKRRFGGGGKGDYLPG